MNPSDLTVKLPNEISNRNFTSFFKCYLRLKNDIRKYHILGKPYSRNRIVNSVNDLLDDEIRGIRR